MINLIMNKICKIFVMFYHLSSFSDFAAVAYERSYSACKKNLNMSYRHSIFGLSENDADDAHLTPTGRKYDAQNVKRQ